MRNDGPYEKYFYPGIPPYHSQSSLPASPHLLRSTAWCTAACRDLNKSLFTKDDLNGNFYHLKVLVLDVASPACLESPGRA